MTYQVTLTLAGGERLRGVDIFPGPTPETGHTISMIVRSGGTNARVTGILKHRAESPATENADDVDAEELWLEAAASKHPPGQTAL